MNSYILRDESRNSIFRIIIRSGMNRATTMFHQVLFPLLFEERTKARSSSDKFKIKG